MSLGKKYVCDNLIDILFNIKDKTKYIMSACQHLG